MFDAKKHGSPISFPDFAKRFKPKFHKPFARAQDQIQEIILFEGKRVTFDDELLVDCTRPNIVVDGDLVIDGNLIMFVEADAICLQGFPELIVGGDVTCKNGIVGIVGIRGDDGGFFDVAGKVKAQ